jgi:hypothetical protein
MAQRKTGQGETSEERQVRQQKVLCALEAPAGIMAYHPKP